MPAANIGPKKKGISAKKKLTPQKVALIRSTTLQHKLDTHFPKPKKYRTKTHSKFTIIQNCIPSKPFCEQKTDQRRRTKNALKELFSYVGVTPRDLMEFMPKTEFTNYWKIESEIKRWEEKQ